MTVDNVWGNSLGVAIVARLSGVEIEDIIKEDAAKNGKSDQPEILNNNQELVKDTVNVV